MCTNRSTPARRAASTTRLVPSTCTAWKVAGPVSTMMPTRCTTAVAPRMRVASAPASPRSPGISSTPRLSRVDARWGSRTSARTVCPRRASTVVMCRPTNPVAPVTAISTTDPIRSRLCRPRPGTRACGAVRDLLPAQAVRVARTIPPLMVVAHCRDDVAKVCERREDLGPDDDVLLDVLELFGGERTLFVQDRFAGSDLADVVQPPRDPHVLDVLLRYSELVGDRGGEVGDAGRMPAHVGVLRFQGVDQGFESGDRKPLQLHPLALQLRGAGADLFLEPLVQLAVLEQHFAPFERPLYGAPQVGELNRLREVIHGAPLHAQRGAGGVVHGGEHEDRELGLDLDGLRYEVHAAGAGHPDVAQHERDAMAPELLQGFVAGARGIHFVLLLREELLEGVPDGFLIVHDQDLHGTRHVGH